MSLLSSWWSLGLCCKNEDTMVNSSLFGAYQRSSLHESSASVQVASFSSRGDSPVCALVPSLCPRAIASLQEMMVERGLAVDHTTIFRWVQRYRSEERR